MRISHKHKFIFIAVPKTGSTSVRSIIDPYSDITSVNDKNSPYKHHTTALNLKKFLNLKVGIGKIIINFQ